MAKKKRRGRRMSLLTKGINALVLYIGLSPLINKLVAGKTGDIVKIYSAGLSEGSFRQDWAMEAYGPLVAAIIMKKAISMLRRTARV